MKRMYALGCAACFVSMLAAGITFVSPYFTEARNITNFKDVISTSAPGKEANHTISFVPGVAIPPNGYIRLTPDASFTIPGGTFGPDQVALYVDGTERLSSSTADLSHDGVTVTSGSGGNVEITLNDTSGISAGQTVRVVLGTIAFGTTTTDGQGIQNPSATGTAPVLIEFGGGTYGSGRALVAIVDQVTVGPVDTRETTPPERFNGAPSGNLAGTVLSAEISLETNEFARCRFSTASGTPFHSMSQEFFTTGSIFHRSVVTGLQADHTYDYYVRCIDDEGNFNIDDYVIEFTILPAPTGSSGDGTNDQGSGSGSGTGSGSTGSGSGSSGGDQSGNSTTGGTRGGGGGGGGLESSDDVFESGDATVIISGYAFPNSKVSFIVDGTLYSQTTNSTSNGTFSMTIANIAKGVYTFGVYATDKDGTKSAPFQTTFSVIGARTSTLSDLHLMPSIKVTPSPATPSAPITFSGYAIQNSTVTIETRPQSGGSTQTLTATSDASGKWSVSGTAGAKGKWKVRAKSEQANGGLTTQFSDYTFYDVGQAAATTGNNSDLNRDGKVNLIDFSILLFHWNTDGGTSDPPADINRDGKVNLTDFSIMIFNWTG